MNPKRRGLGQGLSALIRPDAPPAPGGNLQTVAVGAIVPNPHQPRLHFQPEALAELSDSIRTHGVLQPLVVSQIGANAYELIAGERRWRAAQQAGLAEVPVIIKDGSAQERLEWALIENIQRADLDPFEEAHAYQVLQDEFQLSHAEIGKRVGKSRPAISNALRLLRLPRPLQQAVIEGRLTAGHLRQLITIDDERTQALAMEQIIEHRLSVREAEKMAQLIKHDAQTPAMARIAIQQEGAQPRGPRRPGAPPAASAPPDAAPAIDEAAAVEHLTRQLGTRVELRRQGEGGHLRIEFYNDEQLESLVQLLIAQSTA